MFAVRRIPVAYALSTPGSVIESCSARCDATAQGNLGRVGEERAEKPDRAQLRGEPEPVMLPAPHLYQCPIGGVEVEVAGQLRCVGVAGVAAVTAQLLRCQEPVGHRLPLSSRCLVGQSRFVT